jgi:hypothetical protein
METMAESHSVLATAQKELVAEVANQTRVQSIKEQMAGEQMKCTIYQRRRRSIDRNGTGAQEQGQLQLQWHWGTGAGATGQ